MSLIVNKTSALLLQLGFSKTAKWLRAIEEYGAIPPDDVRSYPSGNFLRGLTLLRLSSVRNAIASQIHNCARYQFAEDVQPYKVPGTDLQRISNLISQGPLAGQKLRIFDVPSNSGYLVDKITQLVDRYIGMDILEDTIKRANEEAQERFEKIGCSEYRFIYGNILNFNNYKGLPQDNNVIVVAAIMGHFSPNKFLRIFENLNKMLSSNKDARIYLGCHVFDVNNIKNVIDLGWFGTYMNNDRVYTDGEMRYQNWEVNDHKYRSYELSDMRRAIENYGRFEIDLNNSDLNPPMKKYPCGYYAIFSLKKKRL